MKGRPRRFKTPKFKMWGWVHSFKDETGGIMKMARREFVELIGASVASLSVGSLGFGGSAPAGQETLELGEWKLTVAPTGDITSLTDGKVELVNSKLGDNHPRVVMPGKALYDCDHPVSMRREGAKT